jgi:hypothetical protein
MPAKLTVVVVVEHQAHPQLHRLAVLAVAVMVAKTVAV